MPSWKSRFIDSTPRTCRKPRDTHESLSDPICIRPWHRRHLRPTQPEEERKDTKAKEDMRGLREVGLSSIPFGLPVSSSTGELQDLFGNLWILLKELGLSASRCGCSSTLATSPTTDVPLVLSWHFLRFCIDHATSFQFPGF